MPHEMSADEVEEIVAAFGQAVGGGYRVVSTDRGLDAG